MGGVSFIIYQEYPKYETQVGIYDPKYGSYIKKKKDVIIRTPKVGYV